MKTTGKDRARASKSSKEKQTEAVKEAWDDRSYMSYGSDTNK